MLGDLGRLRVDLPRQWLRYVGGRRVGDQPSLWCTNRIALSVHVAS